MTFEEKIKYIDKDKGFGEFKKFTNVDDFPKLDGETKSILKTYGVYSYHQGRLITDGKLIKIDDTKIQFGKSPWINTFYFIDTSKGNKVFGFDKSDKEIFPVNTSIKKYIECLFVMYYFSEEIEGEEIFGEYYVNENYKKYAAKLKEMFLEIEPSIMETSWSSEVLEREIGAL
ncbi:hypothetical protein [Flavobacterium sp.]|uniref:hypothetical protein n=1 Tax=Flavobacterium sp. TaxID=239 RepID=UPI0035280175